VSGSIAIGFFTSTAAGILVALLLAPFRELGRFFFVLNAFLAFLCLCFAAPYRVSARADAPGTLVLALVAMVLVMVYLAALLLLRRGRSSTGLLVAAAGTTLIATAADGWRAAGAAGPKWFFGANALAAAALLGAVTVGMLLGHWYLVRARLDVSHLMKFARFFAIAVVARAGLWLAGLLDSGLRSPSGLDHFVRTLAIDRGVFFWQRVFFGIVGPAGLACMVYETARIRSTQSATGILYIAVIFVVYGEFLARYLSVAGAGPM